MKNLVLTTAIALSVAAPVMAKSQLEASLGVEAGQYTIGELALLADAATNTGGEGRVYLGYSKVRFSTSDVHNSTARAIFQQLADESRENE